MNTYAVWVQIADWTRVYVVDADTGRDAIDVATQRFWSENSGYRGSIVAVLAPKGNEDA